jgi:hypothetical protein
MSWGTSLSGVGQTMQLLSSVEARFGSDAVYVVGPTAEYGVYVERGTSRMEPQPYIEPAVRSVQSDLDEITDGLVGTDEMIRAIALEVERRAKKRAPVDTGNLRASISVERVR